MRITNILLINTILFIALGIAFALYGPIIVNAYGILNFTEADGGVYWFTASFARLAGAALFGYGFLLWAVHDLIIKDSATPEKYRKVILALLMSNILGLFIAVVQQWQIWINAAGWLTVGIFVIFTIAYAYSLVKSNQ